MIEQALHSLIVADSTFYELANDRLSPVLLDEKAHYPAATYQLINKRFLYALDGRVNFIKARIQFDTWGKTYAQAKALAEAIIKVLDGYRGPCNFHVAIQDVQIIASADYYERDAHTYRVLTEFYVDYSE